MKEIELLSKYGLVKTCKIVNNQIVTIVLTEGFKENMKITFEFLNKCQELFDDYPKMETCITEENLAIIVLSK